MPIGVIVNALALALGGLCGSFIKDHLTEEFQTKLNLVLGICSMCIGIAAIVLMENMPAVVFSIIVGSVIGILIKLEQRINQGAAFMQKKTARLIKGQENADPAEMITVIVLFCASGTGIYGSILSGFTGDHSILFAKAILDFFTAMIFACSLGRFVSLVAIPQIIIFLILFFCAGWIYPLTTATMINDFKACGGFIMLATGIRIAKIKNFPIADMIPGMVLVMPISWLWVTYILPLV